MATKKTQHRDRELRRLALAERWDDVKVLLMARLDQNPADTAAKAELQRLVEGRPLRITLSAAERLAADADDAEQALSLLQRMHPVDSLKNLPRQELKQLLQQIKPKEAIISKAKRTCSAAQQAYVAEIKKRLRKFSSAYTRKFIRRSALVMLCIGTIIGARMYLKQRAEQAAAALSAAIQQKNLHELKRAKQEADTKINRFFCPEITESLAAAQDWENAILIEFKKLREIVAELETGKRHYAGLTASELQQIDRRVHQLVIGKDDLLPKWQKLYKQETLRLEALKKQLVSQLEASMPQQPVFCGEPDADEAALTQYIQALRLKETEARKLITEYAADTKLLPPIQQAQASARQIKEEIQQMRKLLPALPTFTQYEDYYRCWQQFCPQQYPAAIRLAAAKTILPQPEDIKYHVQDPTGNYTAQLIKAAEACLVHGQSSFTAAYPATQEQIHIPQDLFTAPSYLYKIYILKKQDGTTWYSTIEPVVDSSNFIIFTRSSIDPHFSPEHNKAELRNDGSVTLSYTDSSHLLPKLNIQKEDFFLNANLPRLLTDTLNLRQGSHPALAQAYIYQCLMRLIAKHPYELLNGIKFSPTLRQHAASFKALVQKHKIELYPGCWLHQTEKMRAAEHDFAEWFRKRRGHDYRAEMARNFLATFHVQAQYCGFVGDNGQPVFCRPIPPDCTLWYVTAEGITGSREHSLPGVLPYSPIFLEKRTAP